MWSVIIYNASHIYWFGSLWLQQPIQKLHTVSDTQPINVIVVPLVKEIPKTEEQTDTLIITEV